MVPLTRLKKEVQFNTELTHVVDVLKGIAAARFQMLERQLIAFEPFMKAAEEFLTMGDITQVEHPFMKARVSAMSVVMVTSDAGFLGGLNTQVVNMGLQHAANTGLLSVLGERGASYLHELHIPYAAFPGIADATRQSLALEVRDHVVSQILSGECGKLVVVYPKAISFAVQEVTMEPLLPCGEWLSQQRARYAIGDVTWESQPEDVLEYVISQWLGFRLDQIFALSRLAEMAARAMHLEGSYQELLRRGKKLKWQYLRSRHEIIDRSIREVVSAQLVYGKANAD